MDTRALLAEERVRFHQELIDKGVIGFTAKKNKLNMAAVPSNATWIQRPVSKSPTRSCAWFSTSPK